MSTVKGLLKGLRYISQIFGTCDFLKLLALYNSMLLHYRNFGLYKRLYVCTRNHTLENAEKEEEEEEEIQIGNPTDVKHVAHIGNEGPSNSKPSWVRSIVRTPFTRKLIFLSLENSFLASKT